MKLWSKTKDNLSSVLVFIVFQAVGFTLLFVNRVAGLSPLMSTTQILNKVPAGPDMHSYLQAALDFTQHRSIFAQDHWVVTLWPPGMVAFHSIFIELFSQSFSVFAECFLSVLMISLLATLSWRTKLIPHALIRATLLSIFGFTIYYGLNFSVYSVNMSDLWFVLMACISLLAFASFFGLRRLVIGGIFLALASYFREVGESSFYLLLLCTLIVIFFNSFRYKSLTFSLVKARSILVVLTTYGLVTGPWRVMRWLSIRSFSWSSSDRVLWAHVWMSDKYLNNVAAGWVSTQGGNWGCALNRSICDEITNSQLAKNNPFDTSNIETINFYRHNAVVQLLLHPLKFLENRFHYFFKALFEGISCIFNG